MYIYIYIYIYIIIYIYIWIHICIESYRGFSLRCLSTRACRNRNLLEASIALLIGLFSDLAICLYYNVSYYHIYYHIL